jgi:hypothetical protein
MTRLRRAVWLLPCAFAAHVLEEAAGFTEWVNRNASERYTPADFVRINTVGLLSSVAATLLVARKPDRRLFGLFYWTVLAPLPANAAWHAGATVAYRDYSPGLVTAVAFFRALWYGLTRLGLRERRLSRRGAVIGTGAGAVLHAAVVRQTVYAR